MEYSHRNLLVNGEPYEDCKEGELAIRALDTTDILAPCFLARSSGIALTSKPFPLHHTSLSSHSSAPIPPHPALFSSHDVLGTTIAPTEQFDEGLDRKLLALQREQVEWSSVIAERRRKAPGQAKDLEDMLENIKESLEWDVEMDEEGAGEGEEKEKEGGEEMLLDPEREWSERRCNVQDTTLICVYSSFFDFRVDRTPA